MWCLGLCLSGSTRTYKQEPGNISNSPCCAHKLPFMQLLSLAPWGHELWAQDATESAEGSRGCL